MSVQNIKGTCAHCGQEFIGRATKKYCTEECRSDFHNRKTCELRKESPSTSPKSEAYSHNMHLLKGLLNSRRQGPFSKSELEALGYQSQTFFDDKFRQNDQLIWIFGKIQLRLDITNNTFVIDAYYTKKRFIRSRTYRTDKNMPSAQDDRFDFYKTPSKPAIESPPMANRQI